MITWGLVHILQIVQNKKFKQYHTKFGRITAIKPSYLDLCPGGVIFKDIQELLSLYFYPWKYSCCHMNISPSESIHYMPSWSLLPHEYMISSRWLSSTFLSVTLVSACVGPVLAQDQLASSLCSLHLNWPVPPARLTTNDRWLQLRGQCLDRNARGRDSTRCLLWCNGKSGRKETQKSPEASLFDSATARSHQEGSWILDWRWCS